MDLWVRLYALSVLLCLMTYMTDSIPAVRELRLSLADVATGYNYHEPEGPGTYAFGYDIEDPETENVQFREEERKGDGSVVGKYGWVAADGIAYIVNYIADARGYRATIDNLPNYKLRRTHPDRRNRSK